MDSNQQFYSIEYTDEEGDIVIKHGFMTLTQANELCEQFAKKGILASINPISISNVRLENEKEE